MFLFRCACLLFIDGFICYPWTYLYDTCLWWEPAIPADYFDGLGGWVNVTRYETSSTCGTSTNFFYERVPRMPRLESRNRSPGRAMTDKDANKVRTLHSHLLLVQFVDSCFPVASPGHARASQMVAITRKTCTYSMARGARGVLQALQH